MGKIRDSARTREAVLAAAADEFCEKGFDAATTAGVARRAGVSKQLIQHHFGSKEALFREVHDQRFRPAMDWAEPLPQDPTQLIAARFRKRIGDLDYIRFLTWEAASGRVRGVPGRDARKRRLAEYGGALRALQRSGRLPVGVDHRLLQLAILALATYPLAFGQMTELVTGRQSTSERFRRDWEACLRWIGQRLLEPAPRPAAAARSAAVRVPPRPARRTGAAAAASPAAAPGASTASAATAAATARSTRSRRRISTRA